MDDDARHPEVAPTAPELPLRLGGKAEHGGVEATTPDLTNRIAKTVRWLYGNYVDLTSEHDRLKEERIPGIGQWYLDQVYQPWLNSNRSILYCNGKPGSGKTFLASFIIDDINAQFKGSPNTRTAYAYLKRDEPKQSVKIILATLIAQLGKTDLKRFPNLQDVASNLNMDPAQSVPPNWELLVTLEGIIRMYSNVFFILDALDTLEEAHARRLMGYLSELQNRCGARVFVSSRNSDATPGLTGTHNDGKALCPRISDYKILLEEKLKYHAADPLAPFNVDQCYQSVMSHDMSCSFDEFQKRFRRKFIAIANQPTEHWIAQTSPKAAEKKSEENSSVSIDEPKVEILQRAIEQMDGQISEQKNFSRRALAWTLFGTEVTVDGLLHVLADEEYTKSDMETDIEVSLPTISDVVTACCGLIDIENGRFVLRRNITSVDRATLSEWLGGCSYCLNKLLQYCVAHLGRIASSTSFIMPDVVARESLRSNPLLLHTATNWGFLATRVQALRIQGPSMWNEEEDAKILLLLETPRIVQACSLALEIYDARLCQDTHSIEHNKHGGFDHMWRKGTGLRLAARFGLRASVVDLLRNNPLCLHEKDAYGKTPLWWALASNQEDTAKQLSVKDTITLILLIEAQEKQLAMRMLSFDECKLNIFDLQKRSPLHHAVLNGDIELAKCLLLKGSRVDAEDFHLTTPLQLAVTQGKTLIAALLLEHSGSIGGLLAPQWRKCYQKNPSEILTFLQNHGGGFRLTFFQQHHVDASFLSRELFMFNPDSTERSFLKTESEFRSQPDYEPRIYEIDIDTKRVNTELWYYIVTVTLPRYFDSTDYRTLSIAWNVVWNVNSNRRWETMVHLSNLPNIRMPSCGSDFFRGLIVALLERWVILCDRADLDMVITRTRLLQQNGTDSKLLEKLLKDDQMWIDLRRTLSYFVKQATEFAYEYSNRGDERKSLEVLLATIDDFSDNINGRLTQLEETSKNLIQLEFSLVSIHEARRSTSTSTSMKRLSWINFIFLPLIFTSGLFGMNVDVLESSQAPWWLYIIFAGVTLLIMSSVWVLFKRYATLEKSIERNFEWLVETQKSRDEEK